MVTIRATLAEGTAVQITNGRHEWQSDEPPASGGTDTGPTPYELLLGSLAACTVITLVLYTRHKGIDVKSINASYEFDRIHADDCEDCEDDLKGFIDRITSNVAIGGQFDDAQKQRLTQIVGRCPVHKTLEKPVKMEDRVTFVD